MAAESHRGLPSAAPQDLTTSLLHQRSSTIVRAGRSKESKQSTWWQESRAPACSSCRLAAALAAGGVHAGPAMLAIKLQPLKHWDEEHSIGVMQPPGCLCTVQQRPVHQGRAGWRGMPEARYHPRKEHYHRCPQVYGMEMAWNLGAVTPAWRGRTLWVCFQHSNSMQDAAASTLCMHAL
jgi:hypothetical protein